MHPGVREDPEGLLVAYRHYEELKAKVTNLKAEADRFKAKLERLTQAGDAVALDYAERIEIEAGQTAKQLMKWLPVLVDWNKSKHYD